MDKEIFKTIQGCEDGEVDMLEKYVQGGLELAINDFHEKGDIGPEFCLYVAKRAFVLGQAVASRRIQKKLNDNGIEIEIASSVEKIEEA